MPYQLKLQSVDSAAQNKIEDLHRLCIRMIHHASELENNQKLVTAASLNGSLNDRCSILQMADQKQHRAVEKISAE